MSAASASWVMEAGEEMGVGKLVYHGCVMMLLLQIGRWATCGNFKSGENSKTPSNHILRSDILASNCNFGSQSQEAIRSREDS
jgi:hypothetical protein